MKTDLCKFEKGKYVIDHIFWQCDRLSKQREIMYKKLHKQIKYGPFSVTSLLSNMDQSIIYILSDFIISIDVNI